MTKKPHTPYEPGVCNIGPAEVKNRRHSAFIFSLITASLWLGLILAVAPVIAYISIVLPAFIAATSYIQAKEQFCAGFGAEGFYNFSEHLGKVEKSDDPNDLAKDRAKALNITLRAGLMSLIIAVTALISAVAIS